MPSGSTILAVGTAVIPSWRLRTRLTFSASDICASSLPYCFSSFSASDANACFFAAVSPAWISATTWALVTMYPSALAKNPEPMPPTYSFCSSRPIRNVTSQ